MTRPAPHDAAPLNFTDTIASGAAASYSGGLTSPEGRAASAGGEAPAPRAPVAPAAPAHPAAIEPGPAVELSRRAAPGPGDWRCPFPAEANAGGIDHAVVALRVDLDPEAHVTGVIVLDDPGHGFGSEADRCARRRAWSPALDRAGHPTRASVVVHVHFER
jgi:protein TonB